MKKFCVLGKTSVFKSETAPNQEMWLGLKQA